MSSNLIAFLAGDAANERPKQLTPWLGLMVLLGILSLMTGIGLLLYLLQASFGGLLVWLLPVIYGAVIVLGWLTHNHTIFTRISGVLLLSIGVFGVVTELLPQLT